MLSQQVLELAWRTEIDPKDAAKTLGLKLNKKRPDPGGRTDHELVSNDKVRNARIILFATRRVVSLNLTPAGAFRIDEIEPALLDRPFTMDATTMRMSDGPAVRTLNFYFGVPVGMLVLGFPAPPATQPTWREELERVYGILWDVAHGVFRMPVPVIEVAVLNEPRDQLDKQASLRALRAQPRP